VRRIVLSVVFAALFSTGLSAQVAQTSPSTTSAPPAVRDSRAVTVMQAGLDALGGATAIGQIHSWTFQATMQGGRANGNVTYTLDTQPSKFTVMTKKGTKRTFLLRSFFVPAVLAAVLAKQFQDSQYSTQYLGLETLDSKPATAVTLSARPVPGLPEQIWHFDNQTGLPLRVEFRLPAELGSHKSQQGTTELSDYRSVGGVLYPFHIVTQVFGGLPEIITIQSVTPSPTVPTAPSAGNSQAGDSL
jgi:hypothetical protein